MFMPHCSGHAGHHADAHVHTRRAGTRRPAAAAHGSASDIGDNVGANRRQRPRGRRVRCGATPVEPPGEGGRSTESLVLEPVLKINLDAAPGAAAIDAGSACVPLKAAFVAVDLDRGSIRWSVNLVTTQPAAVSEGL